VEATKAQGMKMTSKSFAPFPCNSKTGSVFVPLKQLKKLIKTKKKKKGKPDSLISKKKWKL
jgi:hypothetical protein